MPAPNYIAFNQATAALTAAPAFGASAATVTPKTLLQIVPSTATSLRIIEWGYLLSAVPAAPVLMELIDTDAVAATVTAHVSGGIAKYNNPTAAASAVQLGTALTGYNASAEGTITATRLLAMMVENGLAFKQQFPLGREPEVAAGKILRVRATPGSAAAVNVLTYVIWEE
jgi:hypothetical protein